MPTFLSDPAPAFYLVLFAFVVVTGAVAARNQDRKSLLRFGAALAVLALLYAIDRLFESPREEATWRVKAMAAAASNPPDPDTFVDNISPSFEMRGKKREALRNHPIWNTVRHFRARVAVWGFGRDAYQQISDNEIEIGFYVKGEAEGQSGAVLRYARAVFVKDPDGHYRARSLKFYNPAEGGLNREESIEGFP